MKKDVRKRRSGRRGGYGLKLGEVNSLLKFLPLQGEFQGKVRREIMLIHKLGKEEKVKHRTGDLNSCRTQGNAERVKVWISNPLPIADSAKGGGRVGRSNLCRCDYGKGRKIQNTGGDWWTHNTMRKKSTGGTDVEDVG